MRPSLGGHYSWKRDPWEGRQVPPITPSFFRCALKSALPLLAQDIFLEARSSSELQRNALVCVMLRLLEYHQGTSEERPQACAASQDPRRCCHGFSEVLGGSRIESLEMPDEQYGHPPGRHSFPDNQPRQQHRSSGNLLENTWIADAMTQLKVE